jgi:hypothetical protein
VTVSIFKKRGTVSHVLFTFIIIIIIKKKIYPWSHGFGLSIGWLIVHTLNHGLNHMTEHFNKSCIHGR